MDEQTKSMIQDMLKRGADDATIQAITGASQADIDKIAAEGKQGSLFDKLGIMTNLQAAEMQPIEDLRTMPLGTQETFGEKLQPTIPSGGSIFTNRFKDFNPRIGETGIQQVVSPYEYTFNQDVLDEEENARYNIPEKSSIFSNILDSGLNYAKDAAGRYIGSQALGSAGTMIGGPVVGGIAALAGLLKGGDLFNSPYMGADAYTMDQYGNMYTASQLNKMNALGGYYSEPAKQSRLRDQSIRRMEQRKAQGLSYGLNRLEELQKQKAAEEAARRTTSGTYLTGGGGDTFNFSDNSGYGGTGTSSPSNVGPGGRMGGGV
jgi:hypothetical protein